MVQNENILGYLALSKEKIELVNQLTKLKNSTLEISSYINGEYVQSGDLRQISSPHKHHHLLGEYHYGNEETCINAINNCLATAKSWSQTPWIERKAIFEKAAHLASTTWRARLNAATMLGQSKNIFQAEIDSACELIDFFRFNCFYYEQIIAQQPSSSAGINNKLEYRALEGFVLAITPFNFTAIAANLPAAPALCGNVVVWKPSDTQVYSAYVIMELLIEAGLPKGVINMVLADGAMLGKIALNHKALAGIHFTGSTNVFNHLCKTVGAQTGFYTNYPKIVGETGGKNFLLADDESSIDEVVTALIRGAFEYQGQKCSATSRAYLPKNRWNEYKLKIEEMYSMVKMGSVEDVTCLVNAVIDQKSFLRIKSYLDDAKKRNEITFLHGGNCDNSIGYFIEPTILLSTNPLDVLMKEEIFGPVICIYLYDSENINELLHLIDSSSAYALTGSIFSKNPSFLKKATTELYYTMGNCYINDKSTGAVVNQQPFGGARASGTNDKAGSLWNLTRWISPKTTKENLHPPTSILYPYMIE